MDCKEARLHLLDHRRGTLTGDLEAGVTQHLASCDACRREDAADRALSTALEERLPRRRAPEALRRSIETKLAAALPGPASPARPRFLRRGWPLVLATVAVAVASIVLSARQKDDGGPMVAEAMNDHLRILYGAHPLEVESGGVHQVKPWFEGKIDFAPLVGFGGDDEFPLEGGAVAYFIDRKAAAYVYRRRLHVITLFVYRADGFAWPTVLTPTVAIGHARGTETTTHGFHVLLWRDGDLGYALVSDLDPRELMTLAGKIAGG